MGDKRSVVLFTLIDIIISLIPFYLCYNYVFMRHLSFFLILIVCLGACKPKPEPTPVDPQGTLYYEEESEYFPNPERGWLEQKYFESTDLTTKASAYALKMQRESKTHLTLVLHSYYMMDYLESDIPQEFIDRMVANFDALRQAGFKAVLRFSYCHSDNTSVRTKWDATPERTFSHIKQLAPYLEANKDVILCIQAGFIGVWGEWYYTYNYKMNPNTDEHYKPRFQVVDTMLKYFPQEKQIALRTPTFKQRYLKMAGLTQTALTAEEAYKNTPRARLGAHNDAYVSSSSDVGTFKTTNEREFWKADTKYVYYGGESCNNGVEASGANALTTSEQYHLSYLNQGYLQEVIYRWQKEKPEGSKDTYFNIISRRMGYRFVLTKAYPTQNAKPGDMYSIQLTMRNDGFTSLHSPRAVELVLVNKNKTSEKYVFPQTSLDPRFWEPGALSVMLSATLPSNLSGTYNVYLNLPDPAATLHDNPLYSIRLANKNMWEEATGYNLLTTIEL